MKNKFILGLILGIFLIGLISALSVTGHLVRGAALEADGVTATLQKVDAGIATVEVTTSEGDTEFVRVAEGETVIVGDIEISASNLRSGTLFTRSGANVEINVASEDASSVAKIATGAGTACVGTTPTTCENNVDFPVGDWFQISASNYGTIQPNPSNSVLFQILSGISPLSSGMYIYTQQVQFTRFTGSGTAYACLGPDGSLFRSLTPCV